MQEGPDQCSHLDALIGGMIVLLNMMPGFAYLGVHLNSGGCIHALKNLISGGITRNSASNLFQLRLLTAGCSATL